MVHKPQTSKLLLNCFLKSPKAPCTVSSVTFSWLFDFVREGAVDGAFTKFFTEDFLVKSKVANILDVAICALLYVMFHLL